MGNEKRREAMSWWTNEVRYPTAKEQLTDKHYPGRHFTSLTGSEIEKMYDKRLK